MENSVFHCLAKEGKWGGRKTREKFFSPGPTIFILPNWEEKVGEKSALTVVLHKYPVLESSKKKMGESAGEKKERMRAVPASARTFLNEEDKENKRKEMEIRTTCVRKKKKKKKRKTYDEMKAKKGEIK